MEIVNVNKMIYSSSSQLSVVNKNLLTRPRPIKLFFTWTTPQISICYWSISSGVLNTANDTGRHFEVLFFCKKYINKASAGGTRRMCTFSHVRVCRTQTYRQAHTSHTALFRTGESPDLVQDQSPGPWSGISGITSHKIPFKNDFPLFTVSIVYQCKPRMLRTIKGTAGSLTIMSYGAKISHWNVKLKNIYPIQRYWEYKKWQMCNSLN